MHGNMPAINLNRFRSNKKSNSISFTSNIIKGNLFYASQDQSDNGKKPFRVHVLPRQGDPGENLIVSLNVVLY